MPTSLINLTLLFFDQFKWTSGVPGQWGDMPMGGAAGTLKSIAQKEKNPLTLRNQWVHRLT
jgi:hypothetical protein